MLIAVVLLLLVLFMTGLRVTLLWCRHGKRLTGFINLQFSEYLVQYLDPNTARGMVALSFVRLERALQVGNQEPRVSNDYDHNKYEQRHMSDSRLPLRKATMASAVRKCNLLGVVVPKIHR